VLRKTVEPAHELITPPGVAVDESVLREAEQDGIAGIVVERVRTDEVLWAPLSRWWRGVRINRGFGPQRALRWDDLEPLPTCQSQVALFPELVTAP
jgi:repressor of nif and glnA expression